MAFVSSPHPIPSTNPKVAFSSVLFPCWNAIHDEFFSNLSSLPEVSFFLYLSHYPLVNVWVKLFLELGVINPSTSTLSYDLIIGQSSNIVMSFL